MTLVNPRLEYKVIRDAIVTLLRNNIASLNIDLVNNTFNNTEKQIKQGSPLYAMLDNIQYPTIFIKVNKKTESFSAIGNAGRKRPAISFYIFGITRNTKSKDESDNEILLLTRNIEGVFRDNITNAAWLWADIGDAEFDTAELDQDHLIDIVLLNLMVYKQVE